ncbi:MAG: histidine kinase dimerization/phospho-acceptor domain-containing protein [Gammaproteobacteria bacterium]|nr:histidine kinase dimerization/phospho-acceptor domain-containing protein [Gammaproteobacteria bacterium]
MPLALVLVALYLTAWIGYRATHRVLSPITSLAREIRRMDVGALDPDVLRQERFAGDPGQEVSVLASALADFTERLDAFVERERNFTRDASHELRSPLTVIAMAVEVLRADPDLGTAGHGALDRIDRAVRDMRELVEAFLLLARESGTELEREWLSVNELVEPSWIAPA